MDHRLAVAFFALPFALYAGGCGTTPDNGLGCPADPQCYAVSASGECSVDPGAVCELGTWQCSAAGKLGSGCMPDGGIAPPPPDAGTCVLATLDPPLACTDDATCAPYGGHCEFDALNGPGDCACGPAAKDGGNGEDACVLDCYGDYCGLPSFTITCDGPDDDTTCAQYDAVCVATTVGGADYVCECEAVDPPHG